MTVTGPRIIPCLFGTTVGQEVRHLVGHRLRVEDGWIGIRSDQATLTSGEDVFRVLRRRLDGEILTWIGLYRVAFEMNYTRHGGYYGAGAWLVDQSVDAGVLREVLEALADQVRDLAQANGQFVRRISDVLDQIVPPPQLTALAASQSPIEGRGLIADEGYNAFINDRMDPVPVLQWTQAGASAWAFNDVVIGQAKHQPTEPVRDLKFFGSLVDAADWVCGLTRQRLNETTQEQLHLERSYVALETERNTALQQNHNLGRLIEAADSRAEILRRENDKLKQKLYLNRLPQSRGGAASGRRTDERIVRGFLDWDVPLTSLAAGLTILAVVVAIFLLGWWMVPSLLNAAFGSAETASSSCEAQDPASPDCPEENVASAEPRTGESEDAGRRRVVTPTTLEARGGR